MPNNITTTGNIKVEDITFKHARRQSEIEKEIEDYREENNRVIQVPISMTPEQLLKFYTESLNSTQDHNLKRVYRHTIMCLEDLARYRKEHVARITEELKLKEIESTPDDIL